MSTNHPGDDDTHVPPAVLPETRPLLLVRATSDPLTSVRVVHLAAVPGEGNAVVTALCGALLPPELCEPVDPGQGLPCTGCMTSHLAGLDALETIATPEPSSTPVLTQSSPQAAALHYRGWGWPVILRHNQVWLLLDLAVAVLMPRPLADQVADLLDRRHCPPPVLDHPDSPGYRVLLAGEPYAVALPWPAGVYRLAGAVPLPPTVTSRGALTWGRPPAPDALRLCREIDVVTALRGVRDLPHQDGPMRD